MKGDIGRCLVLISALLSGFKSRYNGSFFPNHQTGLVPALCDRQFLLAQQLSLAAWWPALATAWEFLTGLDSWISES